jgi:hypothetical protein
MDKAAQLQKQPEFALATEKTNFGQRLSTWVGKESKDSILHSRKEKEVDGICSKTPKVDGRRVVTKRIAMQKSNEVIANKLEAHTVHNRLHNPRFPFIQLSAPLSLCGHTVSVSYTILGRKYTVSSTFIFERKFSLCACASRCGVRNFNGSFRFTFSFSLY